MEFFVDMPRTVEETPKLGDIFRQVTHVTGDKETYAEGTENRSQDHDDYGLYLHFQLVVQPNGPSSAARTRRGWGSAGTKC